LVLAETGHDDWLLCQITSKSYTDPDAIRLSSADLSRGFLNTISYVRPMKLFTTNVGLIVKRVAIMRPDIFRSALTVVIESLQENLPPTD